jgi:hypothetical protein
MCHYLECQRRTGAVSSNQARFRHEQVSFAGKTTAWKRTAESGNTMTYHFCPTRGSAVLWENEGSRRHWQLRRPDFPRADHRSVGRHPWVSLPPDTPPKRAAKQG